MTRLQRDIVRCTIDARMIATKLACANVPMRLQAQQLRLLIIALVAGVVLSQLTPLLAGTSLARRICVHSLQVCSGCAVGTVATSEVDSCCVPGGGCVNEQADDQTEPSDREPADESSESECTCCVLITLTMPLASISCDNHQLFAGRCVEKSLLPAVCHAQGWVDSILRPPSI